MSTMTSFFFPAGCQCFAFFESEFAASPVWLLAHHFKHDVSLSNPEKIVASILPDVGRMPSRWWDLGWLVFISAT